MQSLVLLVDSDKVALEEARNYFAKQGYACLWTEFGAEALEILAYYPVDCVVLNMTLVDESGLAVCEKIRKKSFVPVLFLAGNEDLESRLQSLTLGDDCLSKPYALEELLARVKLLIRNNKAMTSLALPPLIINGQSQSVTIDGRNIPLTETEFGILYCLARTPNVPMQYQELYESVWNQPYLHQGGRETLVTIISGLRRKLCFSPNFYNMIKSRRGIGYTLLHPPEKYKEYDD